MPSWTDETQPTGVQALDWGDLRVLLAICRAGSLAGAARSLGKDHSTLFRKLNRIESRAGVRFFERLPSGYTMTDAGELALRFGERIENDFHALSREIDGRDARIEGHVRITAPDGITMVHLPPIIAAFHELHPRVTVELVAGTAAFDLSRREADIAIRATRRPPDDTLGRKVCDFRFAPYAAPSYLESAGQRALSEYDWVLLSGVETWFIPALWKDERQAMEQTVLHTNAVMAARHAAERGMGVTALPCYLGDVSDALVRVAPPFDKHQMELWIVTHPVLRHTARVRVLMSFLRDAFEPKAALFAGDLATTH